MSKIRLVIALLLFISSIQAFGHRENRYYLHGHTGEEEIVIQMDEYGDACMLIYFTETDKFDHVMEGMIVDSASFELFSYKWDKEQKERVKVDALVLEEYEMDKWKGTWTKINGNEVQFRLKPIDTNSIDHPYLSTVKKYKISPYVAYRTRDIDFVAERKERISRGTYIQNTRDPESQMSGFRVMPNKKKFPRVDSINERLTADHLYAVNSLYSCIYQREKGIYKLEYEVSFLNRNLIGFITTIHAGCNGSSGQKIVTYTTLQLNDAKPVILEDIIWFDDIAKPALRKGGYQWFQYRYKVFGPKILSVLTTLYPDSIAPGNENECDYSDIKVWQFPNWYLTKKGICIVSKSTMEKKECDGTTWSVIPLTMVQEYLVNDAGFLD